MVPVATCRHQGSSTQIHRQISTLYASKLHLQVAAARLEQVLSIYGSRCQQQHLWQQVPTAVCKAFSTREDSILDIPPPFFDEPARQPTEEEAFAIATGSKLTPEQQLAKQLQLPLTLRIRLPPGAPTERQLMSQIQAATTWQELEAVVYQQRVASAGTASTAASRSSARAPTSSSTVPAPSAGQQQQQQQQQQNDATMVKPLPQKRRRQQPQPLSVTVQPQTQNPEQTAAPQGKGLAETARMGSSSSSSSMGQLVASPLQPEVAKPSPLLNHLHTTEAFRRLAQLLPANPQRLKPDQRGRAAALTDFLSRQALALAKTLEIDPRGIAHVARALSQLGHRDEALMAELQEAALVEVQGFKGQYVSMLLGALVRLGLSPEPQLLQALTQHIKANPHLFSHQCLANTIWAFAKLSSSSSSSSSRAGATGNTAVTVTVTNTPAAAGTNSGTAGSTFSNSAAGGTGVSSTAGSTSSSSTAGSTPDGNVGGSTLSSPVAGQIEVQQELVQVLLQRCHPQMHFWSSGHLAQAAWGLAWLGAKPDETWCKSLLLASRKRLRKMPPRDLANIIAALPALKALPDQDWLDAFCTTSAAKMKHSEAVGMYSILFGLVRLKQQQRREREKAARQQHRRQRWLLQQQQQQQQQDRAAGTSLQGEAALSGSEHVPALSPAEVASSGTAESAESAGAAEAAAPRAAEVKELSAAEVKLLRAAAMWLERLQGSLTPQQLAGVIISLAELLPADMLKQAAALQHQGQQVTGDEEPVQEGLDEQQQQQQSGCVQQVQEGLQDDQQKEQQLIASLAVLVPSWRVAVEEQQLVASLPKKQARFFGVAWGRIKRHFV